MRMIEVPLFKFDELSDKAKEKARDWWRRCEDQDLDLLDRDDVEQIANILGIEFDQATVKLMGGGTRGRPKINWSGFSSQGDGASFEGRYDYAKGMVKKIKEYAPKDEEIHRIADELFDLQKKNFYKIEARMKRGPGSNFYSHSGTMSVDVYLRGEDAPREIEDSVKQLMRDFADWIYSQLEKDYEWRMADEQVDDNIRANEYEFDENGEIA